MSILWADGFDVYGDDESFMLDGAWAEYTGATAGNVGSAFLDTTKARTGSRALCFYGNPEFGGVFGSGTNNPHYRRVFGANYTEVGIAMAIYMEELPANSQRIGIMFCDEDNASQIRCYIIPTGAVEVMRGGGDTINDAATSIVTSAVGLTAKGWNHIEIYARCGNADGAVEIRCNGVTVLSQTGIDTQATSKTHFAQVRIGELRTTTASTGMQAKWWIDDVVAWNTEGDFNNNFVGDKKVYTKFPTIDGSVQNWAPATGTDGYAMVDNAPPTDDTAYISTSTAGDISTFGVDDIPAEVVSIAAVIPMVRAVKTDAGNAKITTGMISGVEAGVGAEQALSMAWKYLWSVIESDPLTSGAPWTAAAFNAAELRLARTE